MIELAPWMIDLVIAGIGIEFLAGAAWLHRSGRGRLIAPFGWFLLSGAALMGALRLALMSSPTLAIPGEAIAALMLVSLVGHLMAIAGVLRLDK